MWPRRRRRPHSRVHATCDMRRAPSLAICHRTSCGVRHAAQCGSMRPRNPAPPFPFQLLAR
jgi:hypothetical protein